MKNIKYLIEVLEETKRDMFKIEAIKKRIESQIRHTIYKYMDNVYVGKKQKFTGNVHYVYYGHRVIFSAFLQQLEVIVYFVQCEHISQENEKLIEKFKNDFKAGVTYFDFGKLPIKAIESKSDKFTVEEAIISGIKI